MSPWLRLVVFLPGVLLQVSWAKLGGFSSLQEQQLSRSPAGLDCAMVYPHRQQLVPGHHRRQSEASDGTLGSPPHGLSL